MIIIVIAAILAIISITVVSWILISKPKPTPTPKPTPKPKPKPSSKCNLGDVCGDGMTCIVCTDKQTTACCPLNQICDGTGKCMTPTPTPPSKCNDKVCDSNNVCVTCSDGSTKTCCPDGIGCDGKGICCVEGMHGSECNVTYMCDPNDVGSCSVSIDGETCPDNWCITPTFRVCDTLVATNHMYMCTNQAAAGAIKNIQSFFGKGQTPVIPTSLSQYNHLVLPADWAEGIGYVYKDQYVSKINPDSDHYGEVYNYGSPSDIWTLYRYKYGNFYPNTRPALLYQIRCGLTVSFRCKTEWNSDYTIYCMGIPAQGTVPFPDASKVGSYYRWTSSSSFFPPYKNNQSDSYGSWTDGIPWIEMEDPVCGGLLDGESASVNRNPSVKQSGCILTDGKSKCYPPSNKFGGVYIYTRAKNPSTGIYYRFYMGVPNPKCDIDCQDSECICRQTVLDSQLIRDESGHPFLLTNQDLVSEVGYLMTEDKEFALEKYLSNAPKSAGGPYISIDDSTDGKYPSASATELDLFKWSFDEINPLPPSDTNTYWQASYQTTTVMPNCSLPACEFNKQNVFWSDTAMRGHYALAEIPTSYPWVENPPNAAQLKIPRINNIPVSIPSMTCLGNDDTTPVIPFWRENSIDGLNPSYHVFFTGLNEDGTVDTSDPKSMCDGARLLNSEIEEIDVSKGTFANRYGSMGAKYMASVACGAYEDITASELKYLHTGQCSSGETLQVCGDNSAIPHNTDKSQLYGDSYCLYSCASFPQTPNCGNSTSGGPNPTDACGGDTGGAMCQVGQAYCQYGGHCVVPASGESGVSSIGPAGCYADMDSCQSADSACMKAKI